jgi:hypothetical protein
MSMRLNELGGLTLGNLMGKGSTISHYAYSVAQGSLVMCRRELRLARPWHSVIALARGAQNDEISEVHVHGRHQHKDDDGIGDPGQQEREDHKYHYLHMMGAVISGTIDNRSATWEKALYSELPKPNRIGHAIGHQVQKFSAHGNSKLAIILMVANRATNDRPNDGERLVHLFKRLRIVKVDSGISKDHRLPPHLLQAGVFKLSATGCPFLLLPSDYLVCAFQMTKAS